MEEISLVHRDSKKLYHLHEPDVLPLVLTWPSLYPLPSHTVKGSCHWEASLGSGDRCQYALGWALLVSQ